MTTVLLIDDDALVLKAHSRFLQRLGFTVTAAGCFADGRALLAAGGYDVILSDFNLDGGRTAAELFTTTPSVPLVLCSGREMEIPEELRARALAVLPKPIDWQGLRALLLGG